MRFGPLLVAEAEGTILAHSLLVGGKRVAKGTVLTPEHIAALVADGVDEVTVALLSTEDVEENQAATAVAEALAPDPHALNIRIAAAGAGRVNLYAMCAGVLSLDVDRINALNGVDPMITIATLPPFKRVGEGAMLATIKIISYAVERAALEAACAGMAGAIEVLAPVVDTVTLIETDVPGSPKSAKGRAALEDRLDRFNIALTDPVCVPHRTEALRVAIQGAPGAAICILTASATSDMHDVAPEALRAAGGDVTAFGMPVDPGNLLFFGWLGTRPVIGLPGCARSPAMNGADWVLERLLCGVSLTQADISAMGVGGLLKEIPIRPRPRAQTV